jgi:small conductance mechanosensitive channel
MLCAGLAGASLPARAQSFPGISLSTPGPASAAAIDALYTSAPIVLDGTTLFTIAVKAAQNDDQPIAVRANTVSVALDSLLATTNDASTVYDPTSLHVEIVRDGGATVLEAVDAHHRDGFPIVTVTTADAEYAQSSIDVLAENWQAVLQSALVRALTIRQPEIQRRNVTRVFAAAGALLALSLVAWLLVRLLSRRIDEVAKAAQTRADEVAASRAQASQHDDGPASHEARQHVVGLLLRNLDPEKQLTLYRALRLLTIVVALVIWFGAAAWALLEFPQTAAAGHALMRNVVGVAAIWAVALIIDRALTITVDRLPTLWELRAFGSAEDQQRQLLRAPTIARALGGFKSFVLAFVAGLATMTQIGIPVGSVVTIGGVAAIAISLAAQNLIRDVVSGFLVLIEDQFVVGDFVTINGNRGTVERLTLRMVQVRDATGSLVTISHSAETSVINHSRNWSRVDYEISVDVASNVAFAISLLRQQIADLESDPDWKDAIVEPAEWIGIDAMSRDGAIVRARIKTAPLRQFALRRELNERVIKAFAAAKIGYGAPVPPTGS